MQYFTVGIAPWCTQFRILRLILRRIFSLPWHDHFPVFSLLEKLGKSLSANSDPIRRNKGSPMTVKATPDPQKLLACVHGDRDFFSLACVRGDRNFFLALVPLFFRLWNVRASFLVYFATDAVRRHSVPILPCQELFEPGRIARKSHSKDWQNLVGQGQWPVPPGQGQRPVPPGQGQRPVLFASSQHAFLREKNRLQTQPKYLPEYSRGDANVPQEPFRAVRVGRVHRSARGNVRICVEKGLSSFRPAHVDSDFPGVPVTFKAITQAQTCLLPKKSVQTCLHPSHVP